MLLLQLFACNVTIAIIILVFNVLLLFEQICNNNIYKTLNITISIIVPIFFLFYLFLSKMYYHFYIIEKSENLTSDSSIVSSGNSVIPTQSLITNEQKIFPTKYYINTSEFTSGNTEIPTEYSINITEFSTGNYIIPTHVLIKTSPAELTNPFLQQNDQYSSIRTTIFSNINITLFFLILFLFIVSIFDIFFICFFFINLSLYQCKIVVINNIIILFMLFFLNTFNIGFTYKKIKRTRILILTK